MTQASTHASATSFPPLLPQVVATLTPVAVTTEPSNAELIRTPAKVGRLCGGKPASITKTARVTSIAGSQRFAFIHGKGGEPMPRETPHLVAAIDAISDGVRAMNVVFLADGVIDEEEMAVIRQFRHAQALALRADWNRRARQSLENRGEVNPRLIAEHRELSREFPLEIA